MAACPNVYIKLGGIGMPRMGFDWHTRDKPIGSEELASGDGAAHDLLHRAVRAGALHVREQLPGRTRCRSRTTSCSTRSSGSRQGYSPTERAALFHDTAAKIYNVREDI